ncbi:type II secretion system F family protein [Planobispora rosea]|uniref:type II secretion system F family protein n=1 Tax=Planobispora rosea TaxID=35762 RepID=UPI00083B62E6|nr:type II secretion system F family protein [Planobispora rosea]
MALALLLGAGIGLGLALAASGFWPARPSLAQELHRLRHGTPARPTADPDAGWSGRLGHSLTGPLAARGLPGAATRCDLAVCGKTIERLLGEKVTSTLAFALLGPAVYAAVTLGGVSMPWQVPAWSLIPMGALGFFVPDLALKSQARERRDELRHALSAFLDLLVVSLAGGRGVDGALADAAQGGDGWAFVRLRGTLQAALAARRTPWAALERMGEEYGVRELCELAAAVGLAGTEGARVRASLTAKAASLRAHQLAGIETAAQTATERMSLPVVGLLAGFLLFTGYPAIASVLAGF